MASDEDDARAFVVACFRDVLTYGDSSEWWFLKGADRFTWMRANLSELRGHDLACFCRLDQACHGDFLLELAAKIPDESDQP